MSQGFAFSFPLLSGLHARPASAIRERAMAHAATFEWINDRNGRRASVRNLLSLLATDTHQGDPCRIEAVGVNAGFALDDLQAYLQQGFLACDDDQQAVPPLAPGDRKTVVHRLLEADHVRHWAGKPISTGIGEAPILLVDAAFMDSEAAAPPVGDPLTELEALVKALSQVEGMLKEEAARAAHGDHRSVLEAHLAMLQDEDWIASMKMGVSQEGHSAISAVAAATMSASRMLQASDNACLQERALDLRDLAHRLIEVLSGGHLKEPELVLTTPAILVADSLLPSRFLALDRQFLKGLVLTEGGGTSHTAILARSFGIPCVAGLPGLRLALKNGQPAIVDGRRGLVILEPTQTIRSYYDLETRGREQRIENLSSIAHAPAFTRDGLQITVRANISTAEEAACALAEGADGIGLLRTEMLFLQRPEPPSEEEQLAAYTQILRAAAGKPVVLRLLDAGGDKPMPFLSLPAEVNPFLGLRAVRWYPQHLNLIRTQLRAALRASIHGDLRVMVPMVAELEEFRWVRSLIHKLIAELSADGIAFKTDVPLGIMVEVPSAALNLEALAKEVDFFCVGTNDLVQYLFAADRGDPRVARESHSWHPATLRTLMRIVQDAKAAGRPVSLCGEMAGNQRLLALLIGLGFQELSVVPSAVGEVKATLANLDSVKCHALAEEALRVATSPEVEHLMDVVNRQHPSYPIIQTNLVVLDAECASKEEAIKRLVEQLYVAGRSTDPLRLEEAVWAREQMYATSVGYGFAVPHCKSPAATISSMAILRLRQAVDWNPAEGVPVHFVVLLAMEGGDGGDEHLRVFARLARRLMDPAFRERLLSAENAPALVSALQAEVFA